MTGYVTIISTVTSTGEAKSIAEELLNQKLAACVQMLPITSCYFWEGKINNDPEILLFIKTRQDLYDRVEKCIKSMHSYNTPEIICLPILKGSTSYLDWIASVTA